MSARGWLPGYHKLPENIRVVGCWAHARRKFDEALGRAMHYLREQWPYLVRYLEDGRLKLSNNRAERSIKPFAIGRKNFLFANSPLGVQCCAVIYSLIETAKENGLDPYRYLVSVFEKAPGLELREHPENIQILLPTKQEISGEV